MLFTNMRLRNFKEKGFNGLIDFHTRHKYLLMMYDQNLLKKLGNLLGNAKKNNFDKIYTAYEINLYKSLSSPIKEGRVINALMHIFGYFSDDLPKSEKEYILNLFDKYKNRETSLTNIICKIKVYVIKSKQKYLIEQYIFEPFPQKLIDIFDL